MNSWTKSVARFPYTNRAKPKGESSHGNVNTRKDQVGSGFDCRAEGPEAAGAVRRRAGAGQSCLGERARRPQTRNGGAATKGKRGTPRRSSGPGFRVHLDLSLPGWRSEAASRPAATDARQLSA